MDFRSVEVVIQYGCFDFLDPLQSSVWDSLLSNKPLFEVHIPALKFRTVGESSQMHLEGKMTRIYHATLSTSPDNRGMVSQRVVISVVQIFTSDFPEKQSKRIGCNGSSLPLFSIPSLL